MRCYATILRLQHTSDSTVDLTMCMGATPKHRIRKPFTKYNVKLSSDFTTPIHPDTLGVYALLPGTEVIYDFDDNSICPTGYPNIPEYTSKMHRTRITDAGHTKSLYDISHKTFSIGGIQHERSYTYDDPFYTFQSNDEVLVYDSHRIIGGLKDYIILSNLTEQKAVYYFLAYKPEVPYEPTDEKLITDDMLVQGIESVTARFLLFKVSFKIIRLIGLNFGQAIFALKPNNELYDKIKRFDRLIMTEKSNNSLKIVQHIPQQTK